MNLAMAAHHGVVPVAPLREAFLRSGMTPGDVARELGWRRTLRGRRVPDGSRVRRDLGLRPSHSNTGTRIASWIGYDRAVEYAQAIGIDPVDVEL